MVVWFTCLSGLLEGKAVLAMPPRVAGARGPPGRNTAGVGRRGCVVEGKRDSGRPLETPPKLLWVRRGGGCEEEKEERARSSGMDGVMAEFRGCFMVGRTPPLPSGTPASSLAGGVELETDQSRSSSLHCVLVSLLCHSISIHATDYVLSVEYSIVGPYFHGLYSYTFYVYISQ